MARFFRITSFFSDTLGPPQGPVSVHWVKNKLELSWLPPKDIKNTSDLEYIVDLEQNGQWITMGLSKEPKIALMHLNTSKVHQFRIFAKNKWSTCSDPLEVNDLVIPAANFGLAIEEVFDDYQETWKTIPIVILGKHCSAKPS